MLASFAAPVLPRFAHAAEVKWRIGHSAPADTPLHIRLLEAANAISIGSDGQMAIDVHPGNEAGSPVGLFAQVRSGAIDAAPLGGQLLARDLAVAALPTVGFAFAGYDGLWPAMDGDLGATIRNQIKSHLGLIAMNNCWDLGFRQITTSGKSVKSPADLAGLRLRTPPEADFIDLMRALKVLPVSMPLSTLNRVLSDHLIDGQESALPLILAVGLFRVQSLCALTNHVWDGQWLCVSGKSWSALPDKLKDIVGPALNAAALQQRIDNAAAEATIRARLEAGGMKFNAVDPAGFRYLLRKSGYYAAWRKKTGDEGWTTFEKYTGLQA